MTQALDPILRFAVQQGTSDVHFKVGRPPVFRKNGRLVALKGAEIIQPIRIKDWIDDMCSAPQRAQLNDNGEVDFAYVIDGVGRFRISAFYQRELIGMVVRVIPTNIPSLEALMMPAAIFEMCKRTRGLLLVTGATGAGKTTTLAAMIDAINRTQACHILTVEDPIEIVHSDDKAIINQREVGRDTKSFVSALRSGLRQDPDVILIGEMRDLETMETAIYAAETGHLVLSTLHTQDAVETVSRIITAFPLHQQTEIRKVLSNVLAGVICQRLVVTKDGQNRLAACEIMVGTEFVRDCIANAERTIELRDYIGSVQDTHGSQTFDQALVEHYRAGRISEECACKYATSPGNMKLLLSGITAR